MRSVSNPFAARVAPTGVNELSRRQFTLGSLAAIGSTACHAKEEDAATQIGPLLSAATLAARIDDVRSGKVAVFYVGPEALFGRGHIPGARPLLSLDSEDGRKKLNEALAAVPVETEIVLYCGCCPVRNCPNVRPASAAVRALGRANAYVLDLPTRFSADWSAKGYPVDVS